MDKRRDQHLPVGTGGCRLCPPTLVFSCSCSDGWQWVPTWAQPWYLKREHAAAPTAQ